jgi:CzcA family heavy metal efflux pump
MLMRVIIINQKTMLNQIIRFSLENKYLVLLATLVLTVYGLRTAINMDVDVFPDLTAPTVVVMTDAHGMSSEEVERTVTFPIETLMNGATGVRRVRSASAQGFSFVWVEFDWGTDILRARQIVSEKLGALSSRMPDGVGQPILAPQTSIMGEIFLVGLQSDSTSLMDLRTIAEWRIKPLILGTGGVSQVTILGGEYKQYQVLANPQKMSFYGVRLSDLKTACESVSENAHGGVIREFGNEFLLSGSGRTQDLEDIGSTFLTTFEGKSIRIKDVAEVKIGAAPIMGAGSKNGQPAIILSISKQPNANTLELTKTIESRLEELRNTLPADIQMDTRIFRQADFISTAVKNVQDSLLEGAFFVIIILFLFLGSFRTTFISLLAIPLSLMVAVVVLHWLGMSINTMSLGGMAIAIGSLVDDAIIDVENVYKRLRQNRLRPEDQRESSFSVVLEASKEIRSSIFNATLIIMVAFLPLFFLDGMEGKMLQPLGIAFMVSIFVSLIVAMTITPILSQMLLSDEKYLAKNEKEKWLARKLGSLYEKSLDWALIHKRLMLISTFIMFIVSMGIFSQLGRSFLPEFNEGSLTLSVMTKPGSTLEESNLLGTLIEEELLKVPEIFSTARRTGRGELDEHSQSSNSAEMDINFKLLERSRAEFMEDVRATLSGIPGIAFTIGQPLGHRIDHMLSGTNANIAIKIFGPELPELHNKGNEIKQSIANIPGLVDLNVEQQVEVPHITIKPKREMLARYGISMHEFNELIDVGLGGEKVADIYEGQQNFDLVLRYNSNYTSSLEGIRSALIDTRNHGKISLDQVADIYSTTSPNAISRENVSRKLVVSANVAGRDLKGVVDEIRQKIQSDIQLEEGYRIEYGGQFESEASASRILLLTSVISLLIIFLILYQEFKNFRLAGIILLNLPLALIGGVFAIWMSSGMLSIPAIIGFITLFGIATRNGILLISNYQKLEKEYFSIIDIVRKGSSDRLNAILMTALTAALALIPLAMKGDISGNEIQSPMAKVILGGLLTSTLLNIYIIPIVYSYFQRKNLHS